MHPKKMYAPKGLCIPSSTPQIMCTLNSWPYYRICILKKQRNWGGISLWGMHIKKPKKLWETFLWLEYAYKKKKNFGNENLVLYAY
jgi:hypothetical protein